MGTPQLKREHRERVGASLVRVQHSPGNGGTGFAVSDYVIVTAAHCLSRIPTAPGGDDWTVEAAIASKSDPTKKSLAFVRFVDPCSDVAILSNCGSDGELDHSRDIEAFEALLASLTKLGIAGTPCGRSCRCYIPTIDGVWKSATVQSFPGSIAPRWTIELKGGVPGGTSGSPVVDEWGRAIGVVSASGGANADEYVELAMLATVLPGWLLGLHGINSGDRAKQQARYAQRRDRSFAKRYPVRICGERGQWLSI